MAGIPKPTPIEVFEDNIAAAERLVVLTKALLNTRKYKMRKERREAMGTALNLPKKDRDRLDWVESPDVFVILKPGSAFSREIFSEPELRPLLRQAVVAIAAAVESYVAEKACSCISSALDAPPDRLRNLAISFGDIVDIEERYKRRRWGYRDLIEAHLQREASSSPAKIGIVLSTVGKKNFWTPVDAKRGVSKGTSETQLEDLCQRRNRIAHSGDRVGLKHATLAIGEVEAHLTNAKSIIEAMEAVL